MNENPFAKLRRLQTEKEKSLNETSTKNSVKQEDITNLPTVPSVDITVGDETVQNLLLQQDNPLELQEKLRALFSADIKTDNPFPINSRELLEFLNISYDYSTWIKRMIDYGFNEKKDYIILLQKKEEQNQHGGSNRRDYMLTLDMAKEIAMIQRNNLGRLVRAYLIWAEKKLHQITAVISQQEQQVQVPVTPIQAIAQIGKALSLFAQHTEIQDQKISDIVVVQTKQQDQLDKVQQDLDTLKQRVEQSNNVSSLLTEENNYDPISAEGNITVEEMANILYNRFGYDTGRNRLYDWLINNKMVIRYKKKGYKAAKQFKDLGWFETETETVNTPFSPVPVTRYKLWITQKGKQGIAGRFSLSQ